MLAALMVVLLYGAVPTAIVVGFWAWCRRRQAWPPEADQQAMEDMEINDQYERLAVQDR